MRADSQQIASISIGFGLSESLSLPDVDDVELSRDAAREPFGDVTEFGAIGWPFDDHIWPVRFWIATLF